MRPLHFFLAFLILAPARAQDSAQTSIEHVVAEMHSATPADAADKPASNPGHIHLTLSLDYASAYYWRGLLQEDGGSILQPAAALDIDLASGKDWSLVANVGVWNSIHGRATGAATTDDALRRWYEFDGLVGATLERGRWSVALQYVWYTSPNGAFETVEEILATVSFDDAGTHKGWTLNPSAQLAIETGSATGDGSGPGGAYLQLGIAPSLDFQLGRETPLTISFPIQAGLSLSNYYEDASGSDDFLGYVSLGARAEIPLEMPAGYGDWTLSASITMLLLGDTATEINNGDQGELVATVGLSIAY